MRPSVTALLRILPHQEYCGSRGDEPANTRGNKAAYLAAAVGVE